MRTPLLLGLSALLLLVSSASAADPIFNGHAKPVYTARYLPDGKHIASGGGDNLIRIWDAATTAESASLAGHTGAIRGLAVSHDGKRLASVASDNTFRLWDLSTNKEINSVSLTSEPANVALSPDGAYALVGGNADFDCLIDLKTFALVPNWPPGPVGRGGVAYSPDGKYFATSGEDKSVYLWDAKTFKQVRTFDGDKLASDYAVFTPDSTRLLTAHKDHTLRLWDVKTGKMVRQFAAQKTDIIGADFTSDGKQMVSIGHGPNIFVFDTTTGRETQRFVAPKNAGPNDVAFAPDGRHIVVAETDKGAHVYSVRPPSAAPAVPGVGPIAAREPVGPIDISVTSAPPPNPPLVLAPVAKPDAIERPQFLTNPKPLLKNVTSVTAMAVSMSEDGEEHGFSTDIIATVPAVSRTSGKSGVGFVRNDGDADMKIGFEEAVRAVNMRYPIWEPGHIDISFGEKYTDHAGPSGSTALALLMLSTLEGFELDPKCAITGDISVDWKVRQVGGIAAKIHGATLDKCLYAAIPDSNETPFADSGLLYTRSAYWDIQVFSIATLQQAIAITRKDRDPKLAQAIQLFASVQPALTKYQSTVNAPKDPATIKTLQQVLQLAPNHLSAKYSLAYLNGTAPKTLSAAASVFQVSQVLAPFIPLLVEAELMDDVKVPTGMAPGIAVARKRLTALRPIASTEVAPVITELAAFIQTVEDASNNKATPAALKARIEALSTRMAVLTQENDFFEKVIREGY